MLKKGEYVKTVRRPYYPFLHSMVFFGTGSKSYERYIGEEGKIKNQLKIEGCIYFGKKELEEMAELMFRLWSDPIKFNKSKEIMALQEEKLLNSSSKELGDFVEAYIEYVPTLMMVLGADKPTEGEMKKLLFEKVSSDKVENLMHYLNIPLEDNYYRKEEYDLFNTNDVENHVKKYEWIHSRYGEIQPYTVEEARKKLSLHDKDNYLREYSEQKQNIKNAIKEAKGILGEEKSHLVDLMQFIVFYRTQRTDVMNRAAYMFAPKLTEIAESKNLTYKEFMHADVDEVMENRIPSVEILRERMIDQVILMEDNKVSYPTGSKLKKIREVIREDLEEKREIKGSIAFKGKVKGKVRVIMDRNSFSNFKDGEILVTSMTTPDFLQIMKNASAFITDEGGITCHAAIVARELKKPCIIGTKIATQVLKDGMEVEVDANNGVVRILK